MKGRDFVLIAGLCFCLALAIGSAFYIIGGGTASVFSIVLAIFSLALGQVFLLGMSTTQNSDFHTHFRSIQNEQQAHHHLEIENRRQTEFILTQLTELRNDASRNTELVSQGFADLKNSYSGLADDLQSAALAKRAAASIQRQELLPAPIIAAKIEAPVTPNIPFGSDLTLALEPIVDVQSGSTAHYRIHLGLASKSGENFNHENLLHHADRIGVRTQLDIFVAREAALLLRRLRARDPALMMFMPIGAATLANPKAMAQILSDRLVDNDVAQGLAFELPHAMLAGLTDQALEGLANLARNQVVLALTNASVVGLDLNALATLNVRFVNLEMGALGEIGRPGATVMGFAQIARASRVQVIVSGVSNPNVIPSLQQISRLASGLCFAAPRRVKREIANQVSSSFTFAA